MRVGFQLRKNASYLIRLAIIKIGILSRITLNHTKEVFLWCNSMFYGLTDTNIQYLIMESDTFVISFMGDGTTIKQNLFLDMIVSVSNAAVVVLKVVDCSDYIVAFIDGDFRVITLFSPC